MRRFSAPLAFTAVLAASSSSADLAVGPVELVADLRALDVRERRVECTAGDGTRIRWEVGVYGEDYDYHDRRTLERSIFDDALGEFGEAVVLRDRGWGDWDPVALSCTTDGGVVVAAQYYTSAALYLERFDPSGAFVTDGDVATFPPWSPNAQAHAALPDGAFLALLKPPVEIYDIPDAVPATRRRIAMLRYDVAGPSGAPVLLQEWSDGLRLDSHAVAAASDGTALFAWTLLDGAGSLHLWVQAADSDSEPIGQPLLAQEGLRRRHTLRVLPTAPGEFLVAWTDALGGWVGRRIRLSPAATTTSSTTTTTTLPPIETPSFDTVQVVATPDGLAGTPDLATDGNGTWMIAWRAKDAFGRVLAYLSASRDDARTWSAPLALMDATLDWQSGRFSPEVHDAAIAGDGNGTWILALLHQQGRWECAVEFWRSTDDGRSWESPADVLDDGWPRRLAEWGELYDDQNCSGIDLAAHGTGLWLAAVGARADFDHPPDIRQVFVITSETGGDAWRTYGEPIEDALGEPFASRPLVVRDPVGNPIVTWRTTSVRAHRWTGPPSTWPPGPDDNETWLPRSGDDDVDAHVPYGLAVASDRLGGMVLARPTREAASGLSWDPDVTVSRSTDSGATWSPESAVAAWSAGDGATDLDPVLAADADGRYLLAWNTNFANAGRLAGDADVVAAFSSDQGSAWSPPFAIDAAAPTDAAEDFVLGAAADARGGWGVLLRTVRPDGTTELRFARTGDDCGDGNVDAGEACDDGNRTSGDGCDANCTVTACGNGIVTAGERCDDGNPWNADGCLDDCTLARCGDGIEHFGVEACDDGNDVDTDDCTTDCGFPACGDGHVWSGHEDCEDGNSLDGDGCDSNCRWTGCGNGIVTEGEECDSGGSLVGNCRLDCRYNVCGDGWTGLEEQCDDGNTIETDDCPSDCFAARCGDGFVFERLEECDDGNRANGDGCTNACRLPRCGDGVVARDLEACDDGNDAHRDGCSPACEWEDLCGDADLSGVVTPRDALRILRRSVELPGTCPRWACDANGNESITSTDSALVLTKSVGLAAETDCLERLTVHVAASRPLASVDFTLDYSRALGLLADEDGSLACRWLAPGGIYAYSDIDRVAHFGFITLQPIPASSDLVECRFRRFAGPLPDEFRLELWAATDEEFDDHGLGATLTLLRSED